MLPNFNSIRQRLKSYRFQFILSRLRLKYRLLIGWEEVDIFHSLHVFACDHVIGHAEIHDQNSIYDLFIYYHLHVILARDFDDVELGMIMIVSLHVTYNITAQLLYYNAESAKNNQIN